jgi:beta-lactam-binding protein with PASTA domain
VPKLIGRLLTTARAQIEEATCSVGKVRTARSIKRRFGKVLGQAPKAGARRPSGTRVSMVIGRP